MNYCVIGANYGDCGKGLMTDYLCGEEGPAAECVRFNGGAQAGHTVYRNGKTHIFSSYGSGTLAGNRTVLSNDVILNPYGALREAELLDDPKPIAISAISPITTPFDISINQAIEHRRGKAKHGSCGFGINETVERCTNMPFKLRLGMFHGKDDGLRWINEVWVPKRMNDLGFSAEEIKNMQIRGAEFISFFKDTVQEAIETIWTFNGHNNRGVPRIYEGAQGLLLSENNMADFPFLTRSDTGIHNAIMHHDNVQLQPVYVTRTYLTRHGAGPLPNEMRDVDVLCGNKVVDTTNIPNLWQDSLRFAPLDIFSLARRIHDDIDRSRFLAQAKNLSILPPKIALTCIDQSSKVLIVRTIGGAPEEVASEDVAKIIEDACDIQVAFESRGNSADYISRK